MIDLEAPIPGGGAVALLGLMLNSIRALRAAIAAEHFKLRALPGAERVQRKAKRNIAVVKVVRGKARGSLKEERAFINRVEARK